MLNKKKERELAYVVRVDDIKPIPGRDRVECAVVGGWTLMVRKDQFAPGSLGIYFEVDSKCPMEEPFMFLESKHFKIKTQKYKTPEGQFWSQGLLMGAEDFGWGLYEDKAIVDKEGFFHNVDDESRFLTQKLGITYADPEDVARKSNNGVDKYKKMAQRHPDLFQKKFIRWLYKRTWGKKILFIFFGKKKDKTPTSFPTHFPYVKKTDQERCENMIWVLEDKTPFIKTQKCDGSSGTFILERKKFNKYEFYVCSRNVRQLNENQKCFYDDNHYWDVAIKYDIENKLKDYMDKHSELTYVCWQGEVCGPAIQKNPHGLTENHLFLFHFIDSKQGKWDIREAEKVWKSYDMEVVPIVDRNFILPDDFEEFKEQSEGFYEPSVCEGKTKQPREGFVYYKTTDPNFSFKNVSRSYLLKHQGGE